MIVSPRSYEKQLRRYRIEHPESLEKDNKQVQREVARAAFMSHPAATEYDFRRCWPSIREELLKQHALEELAANPALSQSLAIQISEANAEAEQKSRGGNLQLLK